MVRKQAEGVSQVHSEVKALAHVSVTSISEVILDDPVQTARVKMKRCLQHTLTLPLQIPFSQLDSLP